MDSSAVTMMTYDANKKGVGVAYLLWLFLGGFGAHRFYMKRTGTAIAQLIMLIIGCATLVVFVGGFILGALYIWVLVDAFLIPGMARDYNITLASRLSTASGAMQVAAEG